MSPVQTRPDRGEFADYYQTYVGKVPDGDILATLDAQTRAVLALLDAVSEEQGRHRYADGKWTLKEVLSHINDTERVFVGRALWFARRFEAPLPGFDQDVAVAHAGANDRPWRSHVEEFAAIRASTLAFFRSVPGDAWLCRGTASDNPFTVRALAWIVAGHVAHHLDIIRERYLGPG
jgi:hypothetical protein